MSKLRLLSGALLASAAIIGLGVASAVARRRRLHEDGQGLHRPGHGAGDGMDRPDQRPEGAGQEADRLRLGRPAQRRRQRRRRRRRGGRQGDRLGLPHPRRPGLGPGPHLGADPGDRAASPTASSSARSTPPSRRRSSSRPSPQGIKVVGWHSGAAPGPIEGIPGVFTNITTDPLEVAKASGLYAVVDSGGKANVILFTNSIYAIATAKTNAEKAAVESCKGCKVLEVVDTPIGELSTRMAPLTTALLLKVRRRLDLFDRRERPLLRLRRALAALGRRRPGDRLSAPDRGRRRLGAGLPAHPRQAVPGRHRRRAAAPARLADDRRDEPRLRRREAERLRRPVHLFINANIDKDGGANNIFDPGNGYQDQYKKIWGVQ